MKIEDRSLGGNIWRHYFLYDEFEITVVLEDRDVELN